MSKATTSGGEPLIHATVPAPGPVYVIEEVIEFGQYAEDASVLDDDDDLFSLLGWPIMFMSLTSFFTGCVDGFTKQLQPQTDRGWVFRHTDISA